MTASSLLSPLDTFARRHIGPREADVSRMLSLLGVASVDALIDQTVPESIRMRRMLDLPAARGELDLINDLQTVAAQNTVRRSLIGAGYHDTITPPVILRNILENPGWYTQYTPYQAEISQGRMEALVNYQTMVCDLTGLELSNASLLDEGTAAAEAMAMAWGVVRRAKRTFVVADDCHPQTIAVLRTRAEPLGIVVDVVPAATIDPALADVFGVLVQYPGTFGEVRNFGELGARCKAAGVTFVMAADLLALALLTPPGELGADIAIGSTQRFGVPMGFGGPHAAYIATHEQHARVLPGRLIGVSRDVHGNAAYRLTLQTREQHIRRDKATSNICTAQVLLAVMAGMYAVYHGADGLRAIAGRVFALTSLLAKALREAGYEIENAAHFDTLTVRVPDAAAVHAAADAAGFNLRNLGEGRVGVSLDEKSTFDEVLVLVGVLTGARPSREYLLGLAETPAALPAGLARTSAFLTHPTFSRYHSEHELLRYIHRLQSRDLSLTTSMIPLGSCTMKLNATTEMLPVTWPEFGSLHPFVPAWQARGYAELSGRLERWLCEITGFAGVSLQPNAGSQGEYAGLLVIRAWHRSRGEGHRNVCLIPTSAHGTNPASAAMAGMTVVVVKCDDAGNIDMADLRAQASKHAANLAALMITYPSTHGVFEEGVREACELIHTHGGQVYMDGANMNAQVGLCRPGDIGADVCHLNLHKTFCIPHGGGGPGVGPIGVAKHLVPFLPGHPLTGDGTRVDTEPVAAAELGSASILTISYAYIAMMGADGLRSATEMAILNANYMAARLRGHYDVLYTGSNGRVAHEFILDLRPFKTSAGIEAEDVAKRLMDYGFHAPTMSWPVPGTLMIEPTESESLEELDRFCEAMILIRDEIRAIAEGRMDREDNPLKNAPHTAASLLASEWTHPYSREQAAYPAAWLREHKFWPYVGRVDNAWGDRNLFCSCIPTSELADA